MNALKRCPNFRLVATVAGFADSVAPGRRVTSQWEASLSRHSSSSDTRSQGGTELDHKLEHPGRSEYVEAIRSGCSDRRSREVYCFERVQTTTAPPPAAPLVWMVYCLNEAAVFKPPEGSLDKRAPSVLLPIPQGISFGYLEIDATSRGRDLNLSWGEVCQDSDAWKRRIWSVLYELYLFNHSIYYFLSLFILL